MMVLAKRSWLVQVECTVTKEIVTAACTREEAQATPFDHTEDERELEMLDWEVLDVSPHD